MEQQTKLPKVKENKRRKGKGKHGDRPEEGKRQRKEEREGEGRDEGERLLMPP